MLQPLFEVRRYRGGTHACSLLLGTVCAQLGLGEQAAWPPSLRIVAGYVDAHLEWPLLVADMARIANVSTSRLHALFRCYHAAHYGDVR